MLEYLSADIPRSKAKLEARGKLNCELRGPQRNESQFTESAALEVFPNSLALLFSLVGSSLVTCHKAEMML